LTAPFLAGRSVVIGDAASFIHLLSRRRPLLNRISTDGRLSASRCWRAIPVAVTRNGGIYGFSPNNASAPETPLILMKPVIALVGRPNVGKSTS
jgi:hypothetical protein